MAPWTPCMLLGCPVGRKLDTVRRTDTTQRGGPSRVFVVRKVRAENEVENSRALVEGTREVWYADETALTVESGRCR